MSSGRRSEHASPFDEMLDSNWAQFEALAGNAPPRPRDSGMPAATSRTAEVSSEAVRFLDDRFGDRWRHEVVERRREADEVIVLCKLTIPDQGITKTQFGSARIGSGAGGRAIGGQADGIAFSFGTGGGVQAAGTQDSEEAAFQAALGNALEKCVALL